MIENFQSFHLKNRLSTGSQILPLKFCLLTKIWGNCFSNVKTKTHVNAKEYISYFVLSLYYVKILRALATLNHTFLKGHALQHIQHRVTGASDDGLL